MLVNGRTRQACSTLVDRILEDSGGEIELRPMSKFPVLRDLVVDRSRMFRALQKIKGWIPVDDYADRGPGPKESPQSQEGRYPLSECMSCGCCLEACPQYSKVELHQFEGESAGRLRRSQERGLRHELHRRGRDQPGGAVQRPGHGADERRRTARSADGAGRHSRLRQRAELRGGLPEEHSAHALDRPRRPGDDAAVDQELV